MHRQLYRGAWRSGSGGACDAPNCGTVDSRSRGLGQRGPIRACAAPELPLAGTTSDLKPFQGANRCLSVTGVTVGYLPNSTPRCGPSMILAVRPSMVAQRMPAPGHCAGFVSASITSRAAAGYAVRSVFSNVDATFRECRVERSTSNRETAGGAEHGLPRLCCKPAAASADAFSVDHRICCSSRRRPDSSSVATEQLAVRRDEHRIDDTADVPVNRDLEVPPPGRVKDRQDCLSHARLGSIVNPGPSPWVQPDRQLAAQCSRKASQRSYARHDQGPLDT